MTQTTQPAIGGALSALGRLLTQPIGVSNARADREKSKRASTSVGHRQLRRDLYTLLEKHPASRKTMRHLDVVERTLRSTGIDAVQALPVKVLARALNELESLVWDWSVAGLAELRSRLAVTVKQRQHEAAAVAATESAQAQAEIEERYITAPPMHADVSEVSHELYEEMERSWVGQVPAELADAMNAKAAESSSNG